jgi:hypothetical protein
LKNSKKEEMEIKEIVPTSTGGTGGLSLLDDPRNYGMFGDELGPYLDGLGDMQQVQVIS